MLQPSVDRETVRRLAASLEAGDAAMLAKSIELCGIDAGFKESIEHTFAGTYDHDRVSRLRPLIRKLTEAELLWLCANHTDLTRKRM